MENSFWLFAAWSLFCSRGADKSLARPGRKQSTLTKLLLLQATQKKFRRLSIQPGLCGSNDLCVEQKTATFQLFFQSGRAKDLSAPLYLQRQVCTCNKFTPWAIRYAEYQRTKLEKLHSLVIIEFQPNDCLIHNHMFGRGNVLSECALLPCQKPVSLWGFHSG